MLGLLATDGVDAGSFLTRSWPGHHTAFDDAAQRCRCRDFETAGHPASDATAGRLSCRGCRRAACRPSVAALCDGGRHGCPPGARQHARADEDLSEARPVILVLSRGSVGDQQWTTSRWTPRRSCCSTKLKACRPAHCAGIATESAPLTLQKTRNCQFAEIVSH